MHLRFAIGAMLLAGAAAYAAGATTYSIDAHILSSGTSVHASSSCYRLDAVIAEPVAGFSSGGSYVMSGGFVYAVSAPTNDSIFANGFEECTP